MRPRSPPTSHSTYALLSSHPRLNSQLPRAHPRFLSRTRSCPGLAQCFAHSVVSSGVDRVTAPEDVHSQTPGTWYFIWKKGLGRRDSAIRILRRELSLGYWMGPVLPQGSFQEGSWTIKGRDVGAAVREPQTRTAGGLRIGTGHAQ